MTPMNMNKLKKDIIKIKATDDIEINGNVYISF